MNEISDESSEEEDEIKSVSTISLNDLKVESIVDKYDRKTPRFVQIDQCVNDCYVYAGNQITDFSCPTCKEARFRACSRAMCDGRGKSECDHLRKDGVAFKQLFYRPLLILIVDLLKTPHFLTALNYQRIVHDNPPQKSNYSDFKDGEMAIEHLESMEANFLNWKQNKPVERDKAVSVPLLLSEFYDGGQLFKSYCTNFWALMIQILNLPPTYRGKLGVGMFVQAVYAGKHTTAEKFLFTDNFCEELRMLYIGREIIVSGVLYFIQARLVLHILDGRAAEAVLSLQSCSNSKAGCPLCRGVTGIHDGTKTIN